MPHYADLYFLLNERKAAAAVEFLDRFLPLREVSQFDWIINEYPGTGEKIIFEDYLKLMTYLENNRNIERLVPQFFSALFEVKLF